MNEAELDRLLDTWKAPAPPPSLRRGLVAALPIQRCRVFGVPLRWVLAVAAAAICAALGAAGFETPVLSRFQGQWSDEGGGLYLQATRMIAPPVTPPKSWLLGGGHSIGGSSGTLRGSGHLHNRFSHSYCGYEYTLERSGDGQYRVSFSPLQLSTLKRHTGPFKLDGQILTPPNLPAPRLVQVGEPFEVTLSQAGGERVYDRIVLSWTAFPGWPGQHRSAQDGSMRLAGPQLYINGQLAASQRDAGSGPVIWVHLPGQGRFLVALDPQGNPRFIEAGHVSGNVIEFQSGGAQFRIVCTEPVVAGGDRPVFVYRQQSFENVLDPSHPLTGQAFLGNAGPASLHQE
ncbi:MAG: hypothetical protein LAQ69_43465 [Acidobacteriia bacterium]|nr:hypothetical protein [Terriglobia bacterium]